MSTNGRGYRVGFFTAHLAAFLVLSLFTACSGGRRTVTAEEGGTDTEAGVPFTPETTTTPSITGTGTTDVASIPQSSPIFDTAVNQGSIQANPNIQGVSGLEQYCLTQNSALGLPGYGQTGYGQQQGYGNYSDYYAVGSQYSGAGCLDATGLQGGFDPNSFYQAGLESIDAMRICFELGMTQQQLAYQNPTQAFQRAQMAVVRCYMQILQAQSRFASWGPEPTSAFNFDLSNLMSILLILGNGH